jgi:hypothetical protein
MRLCPFILALTTPLLAFAQEEAPKKEEKAEAKEAAAAQSQTFTIKRGLFAEGDLGIYMSFGGVNTNRVDVPSKPVSNIQPYVGLTFGYDVFSTSSFALGIGVRLAMGLNGGAGRADPNVQPADDVNTSSNDFSLQEAGAAINVIVLLTDRLALSFKLDGGAGFLTPDPTLPAADVNAGKYLFAPMFGGALGLELYTLLNDFSLGLQARFVGAIGGGEFIPGLSVTVPIKYTF